MMRTGPIRKKKPATKSAKWYCRECDKIAGEICRSVGKCAHCGREEGRFEWAHCKSRRFLCIRYDPRNSFCLCHHCHREFTCHPDNWTRWVDSVDPGRWEYLNEKLQAGIKINWQLIHAGLVEIRSQQ